MRRSSLPYRDQGGFAAGTPRASIKSGSPGAMKMAGRQGCATVTTFNEYRSSGPAIAEAETALPGWLVGLVHDAMHPGLTPRERGVLELVGLALTNREIAVLLCLSEKTVKRHVTVVMRKLGARNRVEAALIAERQHHPEPGMP